MGEPVGGARRVREMLKPDGIFMIVEPFAGDSLAENMNPVGRLYYAASTMICTPGSLAQEVGLGLGAQAGPKRLGEVLAEAGFSRVRVATTTPFNLILERSDEHTSELQSLMRNSYAVFCLKKKTQLYH